MLKNIINFFVKIKAKFFILLLKLKFFKSKGSNKNLININEKYKMLEISSKWNTNNLIECYEKLQKLEEKEYLSKKEEQTFDILLRKAFELKRRYELDKIEIIKLNNELKKVILNNS